MADVESSEVFDDELLSAYVDGELDEDQRALVEQRLRDDPRAKQLVDELQDLSATLQALPREQAGRELCEGVLQQTEEKMVSRAIGENRTSVSRRWVWAAMAIAATLVLMVYLPDAEKKEQQVAKATVGAKPQAEGDAVAELHASAEASREESPAEEVELFAEADLDDLATAEFTDEADGEVFLIHITLADAETGLQRFDELLASNRIDLVAESAEVVELRGKAKAAGAVASRGATASSSREISSQTETVLVEATAVQIENVLLSCNTDTKNWNSLSFGNQEDSRLPVPRWRSFERMGNAVAKPSAVIDSVDAVKGDEEKSNPAAQIRVLFVLHPSELSSEPAVDFSGKKAVTGK